MRLALLLILVSLNIYGASVSHIIVLNPSSKEIELSQDDLNHFKITLFNASRSDSLVIPRYNNCLHFKGKLAGYNGQFILFGKSISYSEVKVEHPKFVTSFFELNKTFAFKDSIDEFNARHHILFHSTQLTLEQNCPQEPNYDFLFWSNSTPKGGYLYENLIGVLMKDSLPTDSLKSIGKEYELLYKGKSHTGKQVIYQLPKGKLKQTKNQAITRFLIDSNRVKDSGVLIDSTAYFFYSSFYKINALSINQIEKWNFAPISGLKSMAKSTAYITTNDLEMGCGLYNYPEGLGLNIIKWQKQTSLKESKDRCKEQAKLIANDKEYVILHTKTFSISGGKDVGKKKRSNEKRMGEIYKEDKELKKQYNAPFGYIEPIVLAPK